MPIVNLSPMIPPDETVVIRRKKRWSTFGETDVFCDFGVNRPLTEGFSYRMSVGDAIKRFTCASYLDADFDPAINIPYIGDAPGETDLGFRAYSYQNGSGNDVFRITMTNSTAFENTWGITWGNLTSTEVSVTLEESVQEAAAT